MRTRAARAILVVAGMILTAGCATSEEWAEWRNHTSHFASDQHMGFSMRNEKSGANPKVTRADIDAARQQNWWGKAITVQPSQIFQN